MPVIHETGDMPFSSSVIEQHRHPLRGPDKLFIINVLQDGIGVKVVRMRYLQGSDF